MNSKERVRMTLLFHEGDRIPFDYWADSLLSKRLMSALCMKNLEELHRYLEIDFRYIEGARYVGPELKVFEDGSSLDIWGVRRKSMYVDVKNPGKGIYENVVKSPLAAMESVREIENYKGWPSPRHYDYSQVEELALAHPGHAVICGGDRLNRTAQLKPAMYLRGMEQVMMDLLLNPAIVDAILDRLVAFYLEYNRRVFENAKGSIDIFFMGDDFGIQTGLMTSPETWRRFFKPGFKKFIELAHQFNIRVMHHSCGAVTGLIPDFIDCGLDILQSLQPRAVGMDLVKIKREYGGHICLQGGLDIQHTLPYGTPQDVAGEVMDRIRTLGPGGGYILCSSHNMQVDTPLENVLALYETAKKYASY